MTQIITFLLIVAFPSTKEISSNFFAVGLGGTYGLSTKIIAGLAVVIALYVMLTATKNHGKKIRRLITSMFLLSAFAFLFYPLYGMMYALSQSLTQAAINLATGDPNGDVSDVNDILNIIAGIEPLQVIDKLVSGAIAGAFGFLTLIEAVTMRVILFVVVLFYPLVLAVRPLGGLATMLFHTSNSAITVVTVSPPIMGFLFVLPSIVQGYIPGGTLPGITAIIAIVSGLLAFATPIVLAFLAYEGSSRVFGSVETSISGAVDINNIPPITMDDMNRDINDTHHSPFRTVMTDVVGDGIMNGDLFTDMKKTAINAVASATAAAGHPYIGMGLKAGENLIQKKPDSTTDGA